MRNLSAALALALAPLFAHATEPSGLTITVQDLARRDGVWPYATPLETTGPLLPVRALPEYDPRDPRNEGAQWTYGRHLRISPRTRVVLTFNLPANQFAAVYLTTSYDAGPESWERDFVTASGKATLTFTNNTDAEATGEYHWRYIDVHQLTP